MTKYNRCPVCFNEDDKYIKLINFIQDVPRVHCLKCNCAYWGSSPSKNPLYDLHYNLHFFRPTDVRQAERMARKVQLFIKDKRRVQRILEAGVGNGLTLLFFNLMGLDADGCEIEFDTCQMLKSEFHLNIIHSAFENIRKYKEYDLVYSSHLIEHYIEPRLFMIAAKRVLKEHGYLYLYTPDLDCSKECDPKWHHFKTRHPFEHCTILSQRAIRKLAESTGFSVIKFEQVEEYGSFVAVLLNESVAPPKNHLLE